MVAERFADAADTIGSQAGDTAAATVNPAYSSDEIFFKDRRDAGRRLATHLLKYRGQHPVVLAVPRGGVPVAFEIARALDAPLDVVIARKLGAPGQPELGIGAL